MTRLAYHGWPECFLLANGLVEAIVVPAINRILQLRAAGEAEGVFWENRALDGRLHDPTSSHWMNFGGDKCWPAPQSAWSERQGRSWPPPAGFDARPAQATPTERGLTLTSQIDPAFGIQGLRHIELDARRPVLRVRTEYRKLSGNAVRVAVWTVTQMPDPECVGLLLAEPSKFSGGYLRQTDEAPAALRIDGRLLLLERHPRKQTKIGSDGASLAWIGRNSVVRIDAETDAETGSESGPEEFPDGGCLTEVYTNPGPQQYVELETLGPLATLEAGDRIERTTTYTVLPRSTPDPEAEARTVLGAKLFPPLCEIEGGGRTKKS